MYIDFLIDVFNRWSSNEALVWRNQSVSCRELGEAVETWRHWLHEKHIPRGSVVSLEADFSPNSVALMLALIEEASIVVPLTESVEAKKPEFREISEVEIRIVIDANDEAQHFTTSGTTENHLLKRLKDEGRPGLVLFSSGSTGKSKAAVHDFVPLLEKFKTRRHSKRTITFLLFDHIGGVNTLLYTLSNAGCVVTLEARTPDAVLPGNRGARGADTANVAYLYQSASVQRSLPEL